MVGRLVLLVGPRGAGKTSLIEEGRQRLAGDARFSFPLRVISQPAGPGDERLHRTVTPAQFDSLRRAGRLALCWHSRGVNYALPGEIDDELAAGRVVVAEAAARVLPRARRRYPDLTTVAVQAPAEQRRQRLARQDIALARVEPHEPLASADLLLRNDGLLATAAAAFVSMLRAEATAMSQAAPARGREAEAGGPPRRRINPPAPR